MSLVKVMNNYKELSKNNPEIIHLLNPFEEKVCAVWASRLCYRKNPSAKPKLFKKLDPNLHWDWLWSHYVINRERWLTLAGFPIDDAYLSKLDRVVSLRMVNPDGTLHEWVGRTLKTKALSQYKKIHKSLVSKDKSGKDDK